MKQFLSLSSVAEFFDTSRSTINRWIDAGVLPPPTMIGGLARWDVDTLMRAAVGALNDKAGQRTPTSEADKAVEDYINAQRARRKKKAR